MTKRVALYLRVSTDGQDTDNQRLELEKVAAAAGWEIVGTYCDHGISGAKGRDKRPQFDQLCKDAARRRFDLVAAWSVDRLGRSLQDLVGFLEELKSLGVGLYLNQQGVDTSTPGGRAFYQMAAVFAEFERAMIQERVRAGLENARAKGKRLGRPKISADMEAKIREMRAAGIGKRKTAKNLGVGVGTVMRVDARTPA